MPNDRLFHICKKIGIRTYQDLDHRDIGEIEKGAIPPRVVQRFRETLENRLAKRASQAMTGTDFFCECFKGACYTVLLDRCEIKFMQGIFEGHRLSKKESDDENKSLY